jgi:hypothetical protein
MGDPEIRVDCPHCQQPIETGAAAPADLAGEAPPVSVQPPPSAWRATSVALVAVALMGLGALGPGLLSSAPASATLAANPSQISGTLTCLECLLDRRPLPGLESMLPRPAAGASHGLLHLRDHDGSLWTLLPQGEEAGALASHDLAGRRCTIFGVVEPSLRAARVARVHLD